MGTDRAGGDPTPRAGDGGAYRKTPTQLATDPAFTGTYVQTATGAVKAYVQASQPSGAAAGDLWFPTTPLTPGSIGAEAAANKGAANGYAGLDSGALVPYLNLPQILGTLRSGYYYWLGPNNTPTAATTGTGTLRLCPVVIPKAVTVTRIVGEVTIAGDAGSKVRYGIYADDGNGLPGALVLDAGTILGDSVAVQEITVSQALPAGVYWVGGVAQIVTTTQPTIKIINQGSQMFTPLGTSTPTAGSVAAAVTMSGVTGALPANYSFTSFAGNAPRLGIKVA